MAEQNFKNEIKESLDGLVIPDLQNIICQFVQIVVIRNIPSWFLQTKRKAKTVEIDIGRLWPDGRADVNVHWKSPASSCYIFTHCSEANVVSTFDAQSIIKRAREFHEDIDISFTFSDANNWSIDG